MGRRKKTNNKIFIIFAIIIFAVIGIVGYLTLHKENNAEENKVAAVEDKNAPVLTIETDKKIVAIGEEFKYQVSAKDDIDGDLTSKVEYNKIDTSKEGEYEVNYAVSDKAGNKTELKQKVIVRDELKNGLPVLMYHFFYDNEKYFKEDNNWLNIKDFEAQLKYLTENDFYFPTWDEVNQYMDKKIKLPSKSVVLTVDDGDNSFFDLAVPVMQKYKVPATSFVVTDWYGYKYDAELQYVVWESHSASMHAAGANGKGKMVNLSYDEIVKDLKNSSEVLGGANIFCYPFGHYNDTAIKALKDTNYLMAFTVEGGRIKPGMNKYVLPRVRVTDGNSMNYYINSVS